MNKWTKAAQAVYDETQAALQQVFDALNQGQQQKILKNANVFLLKQKKQLPLFRRRATAIWLQYACRPI